MSLILPMSQINGRSNPDPATRTDGPDPASGEPFRQELIQALGLKARTVEAPTLPSTGGLPTSTAERLDALGAALRALLGGETTAVEGEVTDPSAASPDQGEPKRADLGESLATSELAAGLTLALTQSPPIQAAPSPLEPMAVAVASLASVPPKSTPELVTPTPEPVMPTPESVTPTPELATPPLVVPQGVAESMAVAMTLPVEEAVADAVQPEVPTESQSAPVADRPTEGRAKVATAKGQTFDDLVELITGAQARDVVRHAPKQVNSGAAPATEPAAEATLVQSAPAPEGESAAISPMPHRLDGPKPAFGEVLSTQAAESVPVRSTEIPASALLNQVTRSIRLLAEGARSELHLKLHPAELGEILVRLTIQDGVLHAQLQTTDAAVKATLDANLDALKARFEQQGFQVSSLTVSTGAGQLTDDGQAKSGWAQESKNRSSQAPGHDGEGDESDGAPQPTPARRILGRRWGSRLDHLA